MPLRLVTYSLATLYAIFSLFALAIGVMLVMPAKASAADESFGSVWIGLVEDADAGQSTVRLERCLALWEGASMLGCGQAEGGPEPVEFFYGLEPVARFASPLSVVSVAGGGYAVGERVVIRESFARGCGGNRPDCAQDLSEPSYVITGTPAAGGWDFAIGATGAMAAASAIPGAWMMARGVAAPRREESLAGVGAGAQVA
jgi:hypothetical protein